jgi:hypothetical protein
MGGSRSQNPRLCPVILTKAGTKKKEAWAKRWWGTHVVECRNDETPLSTEQPNGNVDEILSQQIRENWAQAPASPTYLWKNG